MLIEIVARTVEEAVIAEKFGATDVELVFGTPEAALTPSLGQVKVLHEISKIPIIAMARPHADSFCYSPLDIQVMQADILGFKPYVQGIVFGCLKENNEIDLECLEKLLEVTGDLPVTFHNAFDLTADFMKTVDELSRYPQIKRIMTNFRVANVETDIEEIINKRVYCQEKGIDLVKDNKKNKRK